MRISPVNASPPPHVPTELADLLSEITLGGSLRDIAAGYPASLDDLGQIKVWRHLSWRGMGRRC